MDSLKILVLPNFFKKDSYFSHPPVQNENSIYDPRETLGKHTCNTIACLNSMFLCLTSLSDIELMCELIFKAQQCYRCGAFRLALLKPNRAFVVNAWMIDERS